MSGRKVRYTCDPHSCTPDLGYYIEDGPFPHDVLLQTQDSLYVSTGHLYDVHTNRWIGEDPFHTVRHERIPGYGINRASAAHPDTLWRNSISRSYRGNPYLFLPAYDHQEPFPVDTTFDQWVPYLNNWGTTGIKRSRPGNPTSSLGQFLVELRDIPRLPSTLYQELPRFRSLGSEYLNVVFGWLPFVSDVRKMYRTYRKLDKLLAQIRRDNGKFIRRKRIVEKSFSRSVVSEGSLTVPWGDLSDLSIGGSSYLTAPLHVCGYFGPYMYNLYPIPVGSCDYRISRSSSTYAYYSGAFRYYIPDLGDSEWTHRATRALFGDNLTPELLWEVLPWSWLIDWFTNVGDIISNYSSNAVDNETLDSSFVMATVEETLVVEVTPTWLGWFDNYPSGHENLTYSEKSTVKLREVASPFGFGISYDSLSTYQKGILAALAISRQRFL